MQKHKVGEEVLLNRAPSTGRKITAIILAGSFLLAPLQTVFAGERFYPDPNAGSQDTGERGTPSLSSVDKEISHSESKDFVRDSSEVWDLVGSEPSSIPEGKRGGGMESLGGGGEMELLSSASNPWLNSYADKIHLPTVSPNSGAFTHEVPIFTPPGRNGIEPNLKLVYSSQNKDPENIFGWGWSINIPYIERVNKNGLGTMYSQSYFTSSMDGELATTSTATVYGAKFDDGSFREYTLPNATSSWTVVDKFGTEYLFGTSSAARLVDGSNSSRVFRWMLQQVQDTNGNTMAFGYTKDSGQVYPASITYTSNGASAAPFQVIFTTEARPEDVLSYDHGFSVQTNYRISDISVKFNGSEVHHYDLGYVAGQNGFRSLLQTVIESGVGDSGTTQLPAMTFSYQAKDTAWASSTLASTTPDLADSSGNDKGFRIFNLSTSSVSSLFRFATSSPNKEYRGVTWSEHALPNNYPVWVDANNNDRGGGAADINGDGYMDIVLSKIDSLGLPVYQEAYIWDPVAYEFDIATSSTLSNIPIFADQNGDDYGIRFGDYNGDGFTDYLRGREGVSYYVFINNADGSGWAAGTSVCSCSLPRFVDVDGNDLGVRVADLNGDGLDDVIEAVEGTNFANVAFSEGDGIEWDVHSVDISSNTVIPDVVASDGADIGTRIMDIDGDGLNDMVVSSVSRGIEFHINEGSGLNFDEQTISTIPYFLDGDEEDIGTRIIDGNDDSIPDFITSNASTKLNYLSSGKPVDVLTSIAYPAGGTTTIAYAGDRVGAALIRTVNTVTHSPGFSQAAMAQTYDFADGIFQTDYQNQKFAGFGRVQVTDSEGHGTLTYNHQGNGTGHVGWPLGESTDTEAKMYRPWYVKQFASGGATTSIMINMWNTKDLGDDRELIYLQKSLILNYDGGSTHKDSAVTFDYATTTGNLITKTELGEVTAAESGGQPTGSYSDVAGDTRTTEYSYATDGDDLVGKLSEQVLKNNSGAQLGKTRIYYDNQSLGTVTLGNSTKEEIWKSGSSYASSTKAYNSYGLVATSTDPLGNVTSYVYDMYNLYVATTTSPNSQATGYQHSYTFGLVKSTNDPNNRVFQTTFDGFGRVLAEKQPDISTPSTLVTKNAYTYTDTAGAVKVQKTSNLDGSTSADTYEYYDGLNRLIQSRFEAEDTYAVKDISYDSRGNLYRESLPYFSSGSARTSPSSTNALYATYLYDSIGRMTQVGNIVGTTTNSYLKWEVTTTDPNGNAKKAAKDAHGRLATVVENDNGTYATTTYAWNANDTLATTTDADGNVRAFTYDGRGLRLTAQDLHDTGDATYGTWTYTYDNAGNLSSRVDPKSQTVNFTYDTLNRVSTEDYTGQAGTEISYGYDTCANGKTRLCSATSTGATTNYAYNALGMTSSEAKTIDSTNYTTTFTHDRQGNPTNIVYPDSSEVKYTYNTAGQPETVQQKESGGSYADIVSDFDYGPHGQVTYKEFGNGVYSSYTFDANALYRLQNIYTAYEGEEEGLGGGGGMGFGYDPWASIAKFGTPAPLAQFGELDIEEILDSILPEREEIRSLPMEEPQTEETPAPPEETAPTESIEETEEAAPAANDPAPAEETLEVSTTTEPAETSAPEAAPPATEDTLPVEEEKEKEQEKKSNRTGLITSVDDARTWRDFHRERVAYLEAHRDEVPAHTLEAAHYAKEKFEAMLIEKGYIDTPSEEIREPILSFLGKYLKRILAWFMPETLYAYVFGKEDFESCGALPCSFTSNQSWGSVTPSLDATSRVVGVDSLKEVVTGEGGGAMEKTGLSSSEIWLQYKIYVPSSMAWGASGYFTIVLVEDSSNNARFWLTLEDWGAARLTFDGNVLSWTDTGLTLTQGAVNTIEVRLKTGTTNGDVDIWISTSTPHTQGSPSYNGSGSMNVGTVNFDSILAGLPYAPETGISTTYYDDFIVDSAFIGVSNSAPTAPTSLLAEGQTNPTDISDNTPEFSAIYNDPDTGDLATNYRLQVSTSSSFAFTYWDSSTTSLSSTTPQGQRSPDISYAGSALASSTTYYWRIKFSDDDGATGEWSTATSTFSLATASSSPSNIFQDISFTYDANGNITFITDHSGTGAGKTITYIYDDLNRLTSASTTAASSTPYRHRFTYDKLGSITGFSTTTTATSTYTYAETGYANPHATTQVAGGSATSTYLYDPNGNTTSIGASDYIWDYRNRMTSAEGESSTATSSYLYNDNIGSGWTDGAWSSVTTWQSTERVYEGAAAAKQVYNSAWAGFALDQTVGFSTTPFDTLSLAVHGGATGGQNLYAYFLDASLSPLLPSVNIGSYIPGGIPANGWAIVNIPLSALHAASTTVKSFAIESDAATTVYFDKIKFTGGGNSATAYTYDHTEQRVKKVTATATTTYPNRYYNITGASSSTKHIFAPDGTLLATITGSGTSTAQTEYVHTDHLGGTNVVTDTTPSAVTVTDYYPYGTERINTGSFSEQRKYIGEEFDQETSLNYLNARYYQSSRGQFLSQDPVFWYTDYELLTDPQQLNSYSYARGNPLTLLDPSGESALDFAVGLANALISNANFGLGRISANEYRGESRDDYILGQLFGDILGVVFGSTQIVGGSTIGTAGTLVTGASGGAAAAVSVPAAAAGAAVTTYGVGTAGTSAYNLSKSSKEAAQVITNKQRGDTFRDIVAEKLEASGKIVEKEVTKKTPFGRRVIDIEVKDPNGNLLGGVEAKTGSSRYTASQRAKDAYLRATGYIVNVIRDVF